VRPLVASPPVPCPRAILPSDATVYGALNTGR